VVINVMFNALKPLPSISKRPTKNKQMRENDGGGKVTYFKLFGENCMEIITTGPIFFRITKYQGFQNENLYEFFLLGT
jgi:hypothetical protein